MLSDQLDNAAAGEGRSISEEIEHRLERSFIEDQLLGDADRLRLWARDVGAMMHLVEALIGKTAFGPDGDPFFFSMVRETLEVFFDDMKPPGTEQTADDPANPLIRAAFDVFLALVAGNVGRDHGLGDLATPEKIDRARDLQQRVLQRLTARRNDDAGN